jgi:hypothetical protein
LIVSDGGLIQVYETARKEGCGGERAGRRFMRQEQLTSVEVDVGRHALLEGFKVNCDLFEFDR